MQEILDNTDSLMQKAVEALKRDLATVSTGRAMPSLLDTVKVEAYGNFVPLNQLSNISVSDSSTLLIQVWDRSMVSHVEKGIHINRSVACCGLSGCGNDDVQSRTRRCRVRRCGVQV